MINWVKGIDRIAILLAIPIGIVGGVYSSHEYVRSNSVWVHLTSKEEKELDASYIPVNRINPDALDSFLDYLVATQSFDFPDANGIIASGKKELQIQIDEHPFSENALKRAIASGGDPEGTLVDNKKFGLTPEIDNEASLIPRTSKRYGVGFLGGIGFALATIFGIGTISRMIVWVIQGFKSL